MKQYTKMKASIVDLSEITDEALSFRGMLKRSRTNQVAYAVAGNAPDMSLLTLDKARFTKINLS